MSGAIRGATRKMARAVRIFVIASTVLEASWNAREIEREGAHISFISIGAYAAREPSAHTQTYMDDICKYQPDVVLTDCVRPDYYELNMTLQALPEMSNATIVATGPQLGTDWQNSPLDMGSVHCRGDASFASSSQTALEAMQGWSWDRSKHSAPRCLTT